MTFFPSEASSSPHPQLRVPRTPHSDFPSLTSLHAGSLISHVDGLPICTYVINFTYFLSLICLMLILLLDPLKKPVGYRKIFDLLKFSPNYNSSLKSFSWSSWSKVSFPSKLQKALCHSPQSRDSH